MVLIFFILKEFYNIVNPKSAAKDNIETDILTIDLMAKKDELEELIVNLPEGVRSSIVDDQKRVIGTGLWQIFYMLWTILGLLTKSWLIFLIYNIYYFSTVNTLHKKYIKEGNVNKYAIFLIIDGVFSASLLILALLHQYFNFRI